MLNAILSIRPEQKKQPKRIRSAHLASTSASRRCRICDFACGFSGSPPMASRSAFIVVECWGWTSLISFTTTNRRTFASYLSRSTSATTQKILCHYRMSQRRNLCALTRARSLRRKQRCRDARYWCVMRHTTGPLCRTRKAAEIFCGLTRESRNVLPLLDAHDTYKGARGIHVGCSFESGEQSYIVN
jgi:hypothetical protein